MTTIQKELPAGWKWVKLGDVSKELFAGGDAPRDNFSEVKTEEFLVPIISNGVGAKSLYGYTRLPRVVEPAITVSARGTIGYPEIRNEPFYPIVRLIVVIPDSDIVDIAYLKNAIQNLNLTSVGTSIPQLTVPMIRKRNIPLPPLEDQKRIAGILNKAEEIKKLREEADKKTEELIPAIFHDMVGSRIKNVQELPVGWKWVKLGNIAETSSGSTPSRTNTNYYGGDIPWVRTGELKDSFIETTETTVTELAIEQTSLKILPQGTLLVAMYGQGQTRGRTGLLKIPATINQACFAILPNTEKFSSEYLHHWFRYSYSRIRELSENHGVTQPNLNGQMLKNLTLPFPLLEEQRFIANRLNEAEEIKKNNAESDKKIEELKSSLLQRAFRGEL